MKADSRRHFLLAAGALTASSIASADNAVPAGVDRGRMREAFDLRVETARQDALVPVAINVNNGDDARYPDKAGTFTKGLPHDSFGRVDLNAYNSFKSALASGKFSDFEKIPMGGVGTLNGPQGGLAFDMCALDNMQFGQPEVPPAPPIASDQTATELLEHYWGALLRDVAFTDYGSSAPANMAAAELSGLSAYAGPRNSAGKVTTDLLFVEFLREIRWGRICRSFLLLRRRWARSRSASRW